MSNSTMVKPGAQTESTSTNSQPVNKKASLAGFSPRKLAIATGICFLITHVTSVAARLLYIPVLTDPNFILENHSQGQIILGALLEIVLALTVTGTAVALFPVTRKYNEGLAIGYVALRTLEAAVIAVGVVPLLVIVSLSQNAAGSDTTTLITLGKALVEFNDWTFLIGPGLICGTNTVVMASLLYKARLVPRIIPILGLVGGPLIFVYNASQMFGPAGQFLTWAGAGVVPIFAWELSLAIWLLVKGFKPTGTILTSND